ncbi:MAG TPA: Clp protease N-terminal domain-containing protein [Chloroflexota bacterium]
MDDAQDGAALPPRWTPRVHRTLARAARLAQDRGHTHVGTEHLLLALLDDESGIAGQVLHRLQMEESIRQALGAIMASPSYRTSSRRRFDDPRPDAP